MWHVELVYWCTYVLEREQSLIICHYVHHVTRVVKCYLYVDSSSSLGFTKNAEKLNGRLAMIGFVSLLAIELLTGKGIIAWITSL